MTDERPPADDALRAGVESGSPIEPAGSVTPDLAPSASSEGGSTPLGSAAPTSPAAASVSSGAATTLPGSTPPGSAATSPAAASVTDSDESATVSRDEVTVRRSPRYGRFIVLGVGAGAIVTFVLTNLFEIDPEVGFGALFGYLLLFGIPIGAALGGLIAVLLDAVTSRRARTVEAERTTVDPAPEDVEGDVED